MTNNERELLKMIKCTIDYNLECLNWNNENVGFWIAAIIYAFSDEYSSEFFTELYNLRNEYLGLED